MLILIIILAGIIVNFTAIVILIKDSITGYGATMGGIMMYTHLSIAGSILISLGIGITSNVHWILSIFIVFVLFILMYILRLFIENKKKIRKK